MLDNPEKTTRLLAALKAAAPFEVELTERLVKHLRGQHDAVAIRSTTPSLICRMRATKGASCAISSARKINEYSSSP